MAVDWGYYDKFDTLNEKYLPQRGEGKTKATQIVTAINKLVYRYYNDGDVFDNTYALGSGEDLCDYANWLYRYTTVEVKNILDKIESCCDNGDYENLLQRLADKLFDATYLEEQNKLEKIDTIYDCDGKFKFIEQTDDEEDYY